MDEKLFGVNKFGEITEGLFKGVFALPGSAYYRFVIETETEQVGFDVHDNRVFKTRADAEARARDFILKSNK